MRFSRPIRLNVGATFSNILIYFASYTIFTLLELAIQNNTFTTEMPIETRGFITATLKFAPWPLVTLILQMLLCLVVLSGVSEVLRRAFGIRSPIWVALYVIAISILFNLSQIPQVFAAKISLSVIQIAQMTLIPGLLSLPIVSVWFAIRQSVGRRIGVGIGIMLISAVALLNIRSPHFLNRASRGGLANLPADSILVLSLDSLRPDWVAEYIAANPNSEFARFSNRSVQFENIVTTTAKTHSSLTAFLTGERPEEHGMRDNLFPGFLETDDLYARKGLVPVLRRHGYRTKLLIDETKFAQFQEGKAFDEVGSPPYGYVNLLVTEVFSSTLYWSYFSNFIGDYLMPIAKQNFAFAHGYKPRNFLANIFDHLGSEQGRPVFLFAHTCSLHYPATSRTPYLERYQTDLNSLVTRYPNFFKLGVLAEDESLKEYRNLARGKLDLVMDEVVEPFLRELRESGVLDRVHVLLMSDHGETFWKPGLRYSRLQLPYHGQPAILDEDSHRMFALLSSPKLEAEKIVAVQGIADITQAITHLVDVAPKKHKLSDVIDPSPMRYSESGVLGYGIFNSILSLSNRVQIDGFTFTPEGGMAIKPVETVGIILQKTRTIVFNDEHWSFFPTNYGYETVVCKPPICWTPTREDRVRAKSVVDFLNAQSQIDQRKGEGLYFKNSFSSAGDIQVTAPSGVMLKPETEWFLGVHEINAHGRIPTAYKLWMNVLMRTDSRDAMKYRAFRSLLEVCSIGAPPVICTSFRSWLSATDTVVPQLKRWAEMDDEWSEFLREHWALKSYRSILVPKANRTLSNDGFATVLKVSKANQSSKELRDFVESHRNTNTLAATFFRRFWVAAEKIAPKNVDGKLLEVRNIHDRFKVEMNLGFYEVDLNWLSFLQLYESMEHVDVFRTTAESYIEQGRLPYLATVASVVPQLLRIKSIECYRNRILPKLIDQSERRGPSNDSWQSIFYREARKLESLCRG